MGNVTHGMNEQEVSDLGKYLKAGVQQKFDDLIGTIDTKVRATTWVGPDAEQFKNQWWPQKKTALRNMAKDLDGFGQSALNNVSEQVNTASRRVGTSEVQPTSSAGSGQGGNGGQSSVVPTTGASWGGNRTDAEAQEIANKYVGRGTDYAPENGRSDDWYQCTIWAKARWKQMGYTGPEWSGNGEEVAADINSKLGQSPATDPSVGAIVSDKGLGHVAVVEEVETRADGVWYRVSEMNFGGNGWRVATADEYQDTRWIKHVPGNSNYTFAAFPKKP